MRPRLFLAAFVVLTGASCGDGPLPPLVATTGNIEVVVATDGVDRDPSGYLIQIDAGPTFEIPIDGRSFTSDWPPGPHDVRLFEVAANCVVAEGDRRTVQVVAGGEVSQTVTVTFQVTCTRTDKIAFTRWVTGWYGDYPAITITYADGTEQVELASGDSPSWSPDGTRLVLASFSCYYGPCGDEARVGLYVVQGEDRAEFRLLTRGRDFHPAWNPVHPIIVFVRGQRLYRIHPDFSGDIGAGEMRFPGDIPDGAVSEPAWSPDGNRFAFTCEVEPGNRDICLVNSDGTGFQRLTRGLETDRHPAWRPDGGKIAFTTTRFTGGPNIALMDPDGGNVTRVTAGSDPSWLPGGNGLVFSHLKCVSASDCSTIGLSRVAPDGTGITRLTSGADSEPTWRP